MSDTKDTGLDVLIFPLMNYIAAKAFILDKLNKELSEKLFYHGKHHTLDVLHITEELCQLEKISEKETVLVKTAALFHDSGFTLSYQDHEMLGCQIVEQTLPQCGYTPQDIKAICGMIMATKIPQNPQNHLEKILCDADLDYLGRDDFHKIGNSLFRELQAYDILNDEQKWNKIQISFLEGHSYHTRTNKTRRDPIKQLYLQELHKLVATY